MGSIEDMGGGGGWLAVGLQGAGQAADAGAGDGSLSDLSDLELYDEVPVEPTDEQIIGDVALPTLKQSTQAISYDPAGDQQKLNFLATYMVKDCGCRSPAQILSMLDRLDKDGSNRSPHTLVQRLYSAAQKARAYAAWKEAHPAFGQ